jgi:hypothetical protein
VPGRGHGATAIWERLILFFLWMHHGHPTEPDWVRLAGENQYKCLHAKENGSMTMRASYWRVLLWRGPWHRAVLVQQHDQRPDPQLCGQHRPRTLAAPRSVLSRSTLTRILSSLRNSPEPSHPCGQLNCAYVKVWRTRLRAGHTMPCSRPLKSRWRPKGWCVPSGVTKACIQVSTKN